MNEALDKLVLAVKKYFFTKQKFEYRFYNFSERDKAKQISVANSIEYHFINSGDTTIVINNTLLLFPKYKFTEPSEVKFTMNKNEVDDTVYEYRFKPPTADTDINLLQVIIKQKTTD